MMSNPIQATHAIANLPIGSRIVACGTEDDRTAYGVLLEHQEHRDGHAWIDLTNTEAAARTAGQIVAHFDDVVLVSRPDPDHEHEFEDRCYCGVLAHEYFKPTFEEFAADNADWHQG